MPVCLLCHNQTDFLKLAFDLKLLEGGLICCCLLCTFFYDAFFNRRLFSVVSLLFIQLPLCLCQIPEVHLFAGSRRLMDCLVRNLLHLFHNLLCLHSDGLLAPHVCLGR